MCVFCWDGASYHIHPQQQCSTSSSMWHRRVTVSGGLPTLSVQQASSGAETLSYLPSSWFNSTLQWCLRQVLRDTEVALRSHHFLWVLLICLCTPEGTSCTPLYQWDICLCSGFWLQQKGLWWSTKAVPVLRNGKRQGNSQGDWGNDDILFSLGQLTSIFLNSQWSQCEGL